MRLIDADKMMAEEMGAYIIAQSKITDKIHREVNRVIHARVLKLIEDTETEFAIPIEWIKKWISERNDFPTMPYNQHIWNMLEDWEKEIEI